MRESIGVVKRASSARIRRASSAVRCSSAAVLASEKRGRRRFMKRITRSAARLMRASAP